MRNPLIRSAAAAVAVLALVALVPPASATRTGFRAPSAPGFGPMIDDYASYVGQTKCSPSAKPGVVAFQQMVVAAYPGTGLGGIGRDCSNGGQSEHKEGRAWDWMVDAAVPAQRAAAEDLIDWLLAADSYGNDAAMARRLGVMYLIWNRKIWMPHSGWRVYCRQQGEMCKASDGSMRHPHTDHVHFSFSWAGAKQKTTFWHPEFTHVTAIAANPAGVGGWIAGANGQVVPSGGAPDYGSGKLLVGAGPVTAMAATSTGSGYWIVYRNGRVRALGDARNRGGASGLGESIAGMAVTPSGKGYWLATETGGVLPFGDAADLDGAELVVAGISSTPTGGGLWLFGTSGRVATVGDASALGEPGAAQSIVGGAAHGAGGYWTVARTGAVSAFGDAPALGSVGKGSVVGMAPTVTGGGYWVVTAKGKVSAFGDALPW